MKGSYFQHQNLLKELQIETQKLFPQILFFPQFSGTIKTEWGYLKIGNPGISDLFMAYPKDNGLHFGAVECKTGSATLQKNQKTFRAVIEERNGLYLLARDKYDLINILQKDI